jgi:hypothetical protein
MPVDPKPVNPPVPVDPGPVNPPAPVDPGPVNPPAPVDPGPMNPPAPNPVVTPEPVAPIELPSASFEKSVIEVQPLTDMAVARIILNKASDKPVYINVEANTESAKQSFEPYSDRLMIPANQTSVEVKIKVIRQDICCRLPAPQGDVTVGQFKINVTKIENATMAEPNATVVVKDNATRCAPPAPEPQQPVNPPAPVMPKARFEQPRLSGDKASQVTAKILLDQPATQDIVVDLETQDGSAKSNVDYVPVKKSLTIKAGESSVDIPVTLLARDKCAPNADPGEGNAGDFTLIVTNITNADMAEKSESISVNEDKRACLPKADVAASFESLAMSNQRGSTDIVAKIVLSEPSSQPVIIDIETQESTAKQDVDYVALTAQLTIEPGQTSIEIPLKLISDGKCVPQSLAASLNIAKQFNLVVTKIQNATMVEPAASVSIVADPVICAPEPQPQPPQNPPTNPPGPVDPGPSNPPAPVDPGPVNPPAPVDPGPSNPPAPVDPGPANPPAPLPSPAPAPKPAPAPVPKPVPSPKPRK